LQKSANSTKTKYVKKVINHFVNATPQKFVRRKIWFMSSMMFDDCFSGFSTCLLEYFFYSFVLLSTVRVQTSEKLMKKETENKCLILPSTLLSLVQSSSFIIASRSLVQYKYMCASEITKWSKIYSHYIWIEMPSIV
jgi:hypothetical protein